ncbi:MAG: glycosyltransferase family 4 protein, partial [Hypericibacter sp.]
ALVLAAELAPGVERLHAHFLHTPASVARYAALLLDLPWSGSAHAKDIWTTPDWEKREKLASLDWLVTCTAQGRDHLAPLAPRPTTVTLVHHGLDLQRFPAPAPRREPRRDGSKPADPVRLLSVGRLVPKKGYDILLAALGRLPRDLAWRLVQIGGGPLKPDLQREAARLGLGDRIEWQGAQPQEIVLKAYDDADLFVLASRVASDGDRDGLPNVLMEAQSQGLAVVSTQLPGVGELIEDQGNGLLVPAGDAEALARALEQLIHDPQLRQTLGAAGEARVRREFDMTDGIELLARKFGLADPATRDEARPVPRAAAGLRS